MKFKINRKTISNKSKTYFIADIAANHDGDINKAFELIYQAKKYQKLSLNNGDLPKDL